MTNLAIEKKLTRRHLFKFGGRLAGMTAFAFSGLGLGHAATKTYALTPTTTEGPYFVDEKLKRSDIREAEDGQLVVLTIRVMTLDSEGQPVALPNAQVDIWHCNADGDYSDVKNNIANTCGETFLRGYQISNKRGVVRFKTIFPGWYTGRTVHIHCNVRTFDNSGAVDSEHQTQIFFTEALIEKVYEAEPYLTRAARRDQFNDTDGILNGVSDPSVLIAKASYDEDRVTASIRLFVNPDDAGHTAKTSTTCG
ncbi:dioxygenase family protein [Methylocucumis oryzae]|nr:hypothetical protein [Methylocucumis oryzae]